MQGQALVDYVKRVMDLEKDANSILFSLNPAEMAAGLGTSGNVHYPYSPYQ